MLTSLQVSNILRFRTPLPTEVKHTHPLYSDRNGRYL